MISFSNSDLATLKIAGWNGEGGQAGAFNFWLMNTNQPVAEIKAVLYANGAEVSETEETVTEQTTQNMKRNITTPDWLTQKLLAAGVKTQPKVAVAPAAAVNLNVGGKAIQVSDAVAEAIFTAMYNEWTQSDEGEAVVDGVDFGDIDTDDGLKAAFIAGIKANRG